jgi:hypothetical protein
VPAPLYRDACLVLTFDTVTPRPPRKETFMNVSRKLDFELDNLPVDVFDLDASGLTVESLTAGHGMAELSASGICTCTCPNLCSCMPTA